MSTGLKIFLLLIFLAVAAVLSFLLFLGIRRDHRRFKYARRRIQDAKREEFEGLLKERIEGENARSFSLIFAEFNAAKEFKDYYGENYYAWALGSVRERVAGVLPKGSRVCLYEYDTYAFLVDKELSKEELGNLAAQCISKARVPVPCGRRRKQTTVPDLIIGAASYDVNDVDMTVEGFLSNVGVALAASGRAGVNGFAVFSPELLANYADYHYYRELKDAIEAGEFALCFQPVYNLLERDIIAYEAMLRWNHNELGSLLPEKFSRVLERTGDAAWVGLWAYEQMIVTFKKFTRLHPNAKIAFSINLSLRQLSDPNMPDALYKIATKYDVPIKGVCFEVPESAILGRNVMVAENIEKLTQCGFMLAVDDFGLEESAVKRFEEKRIFDWVKLDKRFTQTIRDGEPDIKNMQALLELARSKNFLVLAQDIEDSLTEEFVKRIGVFCGQGRYLGDAQLLEVD